MRGTEQAGCRRERVRHALGIICHVLAAVPHTASGAPYGRPVQHTAYQAAEPRCGGQTSNLALADAPSLHPRIDLLQRVPHAEPERELVVLVDGAELAEQQRVEGVVALLLHAAVEGDAYDFARLRALEGQLQQLLHRVHVVLRLHHHQENLPQSQRERAEEILWEWARSAWWWSVLAARAGRALGAGCGRAAAAGGGRDRRRDALAHPTHTHTHERAYRFADVSAHLLLARELHQLLVLLVCPLLIVELDLTAAPSLPGLRRHTTCYLYQGGHEDRVQASALLPPPGSTIHPLSVPATRSQYQLRALSTSYAVGPYAFCSSTIGSLSIESAVPHARSQYQICGTAHALCSTAEDRAGSYGPRRRLCTISSHAGRSWAAPPAWQYHSPTQCQIVVPFPDSVPGISEYHMPTQYCILCTRSENHAPTQYKVIVSYPDSAPDMPWHRTPT
eukprot:3811283-Rhodomonas_salina.1